MTRPHATIAGRWGNGAGRVALHAALLAARTLPGDLFPEVFLGWLRIAWTRGDAADQARQWRILTRDMRL